MLPLEIATQQKTSPVTKIVEGFTFLLCTGKMNQLSPLTWIAPVSVIPRFLEATFDFNAKVGRPL